MGVIKFTIVVNVECGVGRADVTGSNVWLVVGGLTGVADDSVDCSIAEWVVIG